MRNDLAAHQGECTLIHFHEPEFSEGFGTDTDYQAFWDDAVQADVTAIVNGHAHSYERFLPMDQNGNPDPDGPTEIIAGTGGKSHGSNVSPNPNVVDDDFDDFGVLQLTLHAGSADFAFKTVSGTTPDSGTISCTPVVSGLGTSTGPASGGSTITVTGSNFTGTSIVRFGSTLATHVTVNSPTSLTAKVPAGSGTVDVTVTNAPPTGVPGLGPTSAATSADLYTYNGPSTAGTFASQMSGYWMVGHDGGIFSFGGAPYEGSLPGLGIHVKNIVGLVPTADGKGYWMIGSDGGVFAFGDAGFVGSLPGLGVHVTDIVGAVPTADGKGYWMIGSDGGVFAFGDAGFVGSLPALGVNVTDIVATVPTATGKGYWMVGSDGGVFAFGDAGFVGSLPGLGVHVTDIVGAVPTATGKGYWMVGSDGGVFAFGDAGFVGSLPGLHVAVSDVVGVVATPDNKGYWMVGSDGGVFAFGDAGFVGSVPSLGIHVADIVAFAPQ